MKTERRFGELVNWFPSGSKVIVALSGGVDSAVVALAAKRALDGNAIAVTADYKTLSEEELESARRIASEIRIRHEVIEYSELENPDFVRNDTLRCFHCRNELAGHLLEFAEREGASLIVDGTNLDDCSDFRPGITALRQHGVRSPLVELAITKTEIRQMAESLGLSIFDKPSNACLASRIPHGTEVTAEKLKRIEEAEQAVKQIFNVRQVRVRDHGDIARIEVGRDERELLFDPAKLDELDARLRELGFRFVAIEASGYKSGNLNVIP